jgi:hypothetical protein
MSFEKALIILEDDCIPTPAAFLFFDTQIKNLNSTNVMVCGSSPENSKDMISNEVESQIASYPLIWGWATDSTSWNSLASGINRKTVPWAKIFFQIGRDLRKTKGILFFTAAVIRVNRGQLKAWDSPLALQMLIKGYKAILPTENLITNIGDDEVASHPPRSNSSHTKPSRNHGSINKQIESKIYNLRIRHILAPIKAYLEPLFFQQPKKVEIFREN